MENLETKEAVQDVVDEFLDYLSHIRWFSVVIIQSKSLEKVLIKT